MVTLHIQLMPFRDYAHILVENTNCSYFVPSKLKKTANESEP